ncbi:hypothetical protein AMTR_s00058p00125260 [Amborella trichopoda]|uniref:Uncharacterized protein n=1 Tax=Amborella trichopoda TaxID=13333 RepID=W1PFZ6_AMBTC|nr:hypothetical protein AMTR_s00058p00125260 [Amborella trichopoda]
MASGSSYSPKAVSGSRDLGFGGDDVLSPYLVYSSHHNLLRNSNSDRGLSSQQLISTGSQDSL